jgi:hypothetical protein
MRLGHSDIRDMSTTPGPCPQIDKQLPDALKLKGTGADDCPVGKQTAMRTVTRVVDLSKLHLHVSLAGILHSLPPTILYTDQHGEAQ